MLKISTLCLCLCASLLFASCGDEDSTQAQQENWYKNRPPQKINIQNQGGATENTPQVQAVPFDFGISAALGAGLLAAVRMARKRKTEA